MKYLLQISNNTYDSIKILLEKWLVFGSCFSGKITAPLCMMSLGKLFIQKREILNKVVLQINKKEIKAPAAILRTFAQYISKKEEDENTSNQIKEDFGLYEDKVEGMVQSKNCLSIYNR